MNKKLIVAAALVFGAVGLMMAHTVKAQDTNAADTNADSNTAMNSDAGNAAQ